MRFIAASFFVIWAQACHGQSYTAYHARVNQALNEVALGRFAEGLVVLENLFTTETKPFPRDVAIALQLAAFTDDSDGFLSIYPLAFQSGISLSIAESNRVIKSFLISHSVVRESCLEIQRSNRDQFESTLEVQTRDRFISNYLLEQKSKRTPHYAGIVAQNTAYIHEYWERHGYPSEKRIGIDQGSLMNRSGEQNYRGLEAGNRKVVVTMLHVPNGYSMFEDQLWEALYNGEIYPVDLATIYAFEHGRVSVLYPAISAKSSLKYDLNAPFEPICSDLDKVHADRVKFALVDLDTEKQLYALEREFDFQFFRR